MFKKNLNLLVCLSAYLLISFSVLGPGIVLAQEPIQIDFFYSPTCQFCAQEQVFLDKLSPQYPAIKINRLKITERGNIDALLVLYEEHNIPQDSRGLVPVTFIKDKVFIGFSPETGTAIEKYLKENGELDSNFSQIKPLEKVRLPFIGEFQVANLSPLVLSIIVGILDGFNACAMVALGFLLAVLVATGARKKVFLIGGTFILVSGAVYFLFISAWLNIFLFLGYLKIITVIVGAVIVLFAIFLLKDFISGIVCKICDVKEGEAGLITRMQRKLFVKMTQIATWEMSLPLTLLAVALVAAGVNMIELVCSLGFPLAYTKILAGHNLPLSSYYAFLLVYIIFYMLDDFLIFLAAVVTLRVTKIGGQYLKAVAFISGIVLLVLGIITLFRPELLALK